MMNEKPAMSPQELRFLQAERETLESLLKQLPASSVIERQGLEFRKKNVEEALASQGDRRRTTAPPNCKHAVLSDMDAEIAALEQRRDKTRTVKRGMMQQLLTGRVRLVRHDDLVAKKKAP